MTKFYIIPKFIRNTKDTIRFEKDGDNFIVRKNNRIRTLDLSGDDWVEIIKNEDGIIEDFEIVEGILKSEEENDIVIWINVVVPFKYPHQYISTADVEPVEVVEGQTLEYPRINGS